MVVSGSNDDERGGDREAPLKATRRLLALSRTRLWLNDPKRCYHSPCKDRRNSDRGGAVLR